MPTVPFKLNQDRRHHIPRQRHKVANWREYDASLRQRGSLTVWFTEEAVAAWAAEPRTARGGQPWYSALAILTALTLRAVFRLAYQQTEGLIGSVIDLLGLALRVPDHTTLSRRAATLEVPRPRSGGAGAGADSEPVHLLVDSTGLKLCGRGRVAAREARHPHTTVVEEVARRRGRRHRPDRRRRADHERGGRRRPGRSLARPSGGARRLVHRRRCVRPRPCL